MRCVAEKRNWGHYQNKDIVYFIMKVMIQKFDVDKMYIARYNYEVADGQLHKIEFIDDVVGLDRFNNPIRLSEDDYLEKVYNYRYRWFGTEFYDTARGDIKDVLNSVIRNVHKFGEITDEDIQRLTALSEKYSAFISKGQFNSIMQDGSLAPNEKVVALSTAFNLSERKPSLKKFKAKNRGKSKWELNNRQQIENYLLDIFQTALTSNHQYIDTTEPLDFATSALKGVVAIVDKYSNVNQNYTTLEPLFPLYQESVKTQNMGADKGVGPMALVNTFRVFMQIAKLQLDKSAKLVTIRDKKRITRNLFAYLPTIGNLYDRFDVNGVPIAEWTSAAINAHVDAAKDPYITRLNVNAYTYDVVALLTSAGVGRAQFLFLPQPILKEVAEEAMRRNSSKIGLTRKERLDRKWLDDIAKRYKAHAKLEGDFYDLLDSGKLTIEWNGEQYLAQDLIFNEDWLEAQLKEHHDGRPSADWYRNQLILLEYFKDIQKYSRSLSNLILASRVDTGKLGKNVGELILSLHNIGRAIEDKHFTNAGDIFEKTFLGRKLQNSVEFMFNVLGNEMIDFTPSFLKIIDKFGRLTNTFYDRKTTNINQYMGALKFIIQENFMQQHIKSTRGNFNEFLHNLFYGDNTIVDRVDRLRNQVFSGTKYTELSDNMLLQMLMPRITEEGAPKRFETTLKLRDTDSKNAYTYAWRDLLEHRSAEVRDIAKDLIMYSFYTSSGRGTGLYATLELVPYEVLGNLTATMTDARGIEREMTYSEYLAERVSEYHQIPSNITSVLDTMFRSSQGNEDLVPQLRTRRQNTAIAAIQLAEGTEVPLYVAMNNGTYTDMDGKPVPYLQYDNTMLMLTHKAVTATGKINYIYQPVASRGYSDAGFNIYEGITEQSVIPANGDITTDPAIVQGFLNRYKSFSEIDAATRFSLDEDLTTTPIEPDDEVEDDKSASDGITSNVDTETGIKPLANNDTVLELKEYLTTEHSTMNSTDFVNKFHGIIFDTADTDNDFRRSAARYLFPNESWSTELEPRGSQPRATVDEIMTGCVKLITEFVFMYPDFTMNATNTERVRNWLLSIIGINKESSAVYEAATKKLLAAIVDHDLATSKDASRSDAEAIDELTKLGEQRRKDCE